MKLFQIQNIIHLTFDLCRACLRARADSALKSVGFYSPRGYKPRPFYIYYYQLKYFQSNKPGLGPFTLNPSTYSFSRIPRIAPQAQTDQDLIQLITGSYKSSIQMAQSWTKNQKNVRKQQWRIQRPSANCLSRLRRPKKVEELIIESTVEGYN